MTSFAIALTINIQRMNSMCWQWISVLIALLYEIKICYEVNLDEALVGLQNFSLFFRRNNEGIMRFDTAFNKLEKLILLVILVIEDISN